MGDMVRLAYGHDIVQRTVKTMTDFDPGWKLPDGFSPSDFAAAEARSQPNKALVEGKMDAKVKIQLQEISVSDGVKES
jgi:salicylate hydroxylase